MQHFPPGWDSPSWNTTVSLPSGTHAIGSFPQNGEAAVTPMAVLGDLTVSSHISQIGLWKEHGWYFYILSGFRGDEEVCQYYCAASKPIHPQTPNPPPTKFSFLNKWNCTYPYKTPLETPACKLFLGNPTVDVEGCADIALINTWHEGLPLITNIIALWNSLFLDLKQPL